MEDNTLYRPLTENYPLVDFVYKHQKKLIGIQVSREVGGKRSINTSALGEFLDELKANSMKKKDIIFYYCPSPQYADSAAISIPETTKSKKVSLKIIKVPKDYGKSVSFYFSFLTTIFHLRKKIICSMILFCFIYF